MATLSEDETGVANLEPIEVKSSVSDTGAGAKTLTLTVPAAEIDKAYDKLLNEYARQVRLPGFRPGKAPKGMIEKMLKDDLKNRVTQDVVARGIYSAVKNEKIDSVGSPELKTAEPIAERGKDLTIEVNLEVRPQFELCNYKGLPIEQEEVELFPDEVDEQLERMALRFAEEADAPEGAALQERDVAMGVLRFVVDGNEVRKEDDAALLLHEGHVIGAHAHLGLEYLKDAKVGEKRTAEETLDAGFPLEEMRGKKASIEFELKKIRRPKVPPFDDELAKKLGGESAEALRKRIEDRLKEHLAEETQAKTRQELLERVISGSPFEPPKRLVESFEKRMLLDQKMNLVRMGFQPEDVEQIDLSKQNEGGAEKRVREYFVLDAICRKENVAVGDEEVDEEVVKMARQRGVRAAELFKELEEQGSLDQVKMGLRTKKAFDFLVENAEIKIVARKKPEKKQQDCGHEHGHKH